MKNQRTNAFTLIELLVVISIVSLLMAILLPSLSAAREYAKSVVCMTRQKQLSLSVLTYAVDFKETFCRPGEGIGGAAKAAQWAGGSGTTAAEERLRANGNWFNAVDNYMNLGKLNYQAGVAANRNYSLLKQCPIYQEGPIVGSSGGLSGNRTIKMNSYFDTDANALFAKSSEVSRSGGDPIVLFADARSEDTCGDTSSSGSIAFDVTPGTIGMRHLQNRQFAPQKYGGLGSIATGSANVTFTDGSGKTMRQAYYETASPYPAWLVDVATFRAAGYQTLNWRIKDSAVPASASTPASIYN